MKKSNKKKIVIIFLIIVAALVALFIYLNQEEKTLLSCEGIKNNENAQLVINYLIEEKDDKLYFKFASNAEFYEAQTSNNNNSLALYIKSFVLKLKNNSNVLNLTYEITETQIDFAFDFYMDSLSESELKEIIGTSSTDIEELKNYFEDGGLICKEN